MLYAMKFQCYAMLCVVKDIFELTVNVFRCGILTISYHHKQILIKNLYLSFMECYYYLYVVLCS